MKPSKTIRRCPWCGSEPLYVEYHDVEWGVPEWDDQHLFEKLLLDGFQAGLSWWIVLKKRENFRKTFDNFDPEKMARYSNSKILELESNRGIIRNRAKIAAAVSSAQAYLELQGSGVRFSEFLWEFVDGRPKINRFSEIKELPATSAESVNMSKALKKKGFKFCGPTITYAFMQAVGMVNDHLTFCFRRDEVSRMSK